MVSVLFVCMGNICRSPSAEAVFQKVLQQNGMADRVEVASAGTHGFHVGETADDRALEFARRRGIDLSEHRAQQIKLMDFETYTYVLAMDKRNLALLKEYAGPEHHHKIRLFLEFAEECPELEVPDPYYGGDEGFEKVLDLVEAASEGLLQEICVRHFSDLQNTSSS